MLRSFWKVLAGSSMGRSRGRTGYYAVRVGRTTGVFNTWDECRQAVNGVPGARYKKFGSNDEALDFVGDTGGSSSNSYQNVPRHSYSSYQSSYSEPPSYSRPSSYSSNNSRVLKARDTFKPAKRTQFLNAIPHSMNMGNVSESSSYEDRPVVYSDGCCTNNGYKGAKAGVGVYWGPDHKGNVSEKLAGSQTNQRAEIIAATRALQSAKELGHKSIELRTDSMYTINGATSWVKKWKSNGWKTANNTDVKNVEDFQKLDKLCGEMDVKWTHVAGHSGIHGNEMADSLAKAGSSLH